MSGPMKSFHPPMNDRMTTVMIAGRESGMMMRHQMPK